jgi:hypothetical protein
VTGPVDDPIPASTSSLPTDDVVALEAELASGQGRRMATAARRARMAARLLAGVVAGTGVLALLVGLAAWRDEPGALAVVALLCLPAIVAPLYVVRRAEALAGAAARPREVAAQAQDLIGRVRHSAELRTLAERVVHRRAGEHRGPVAAGRAGRLRGGLELARLASTVVGQAEPDPARHPLLVAFTPDRLARTWWAVGVSLWAWPLAGAVLLVSAVVLAADAL